MSGYGFAYFRWRYILWGHFQIDESAKYSSAPYIELGINARKAFSEMQLLFDIRRGFKTWMQERKP